MFIVMRFLETSNKDEVLFVTSDKKLVDLFIKNNPSTYFEELEINQWNPDIKQEFFCCLPENKEKLFKEHLEKEINLNHVLSHTSLMLYLQEHRREEVNNHSIRYSIQLCWNVFKKIKDLTVLEYYKTGYHYKYLLKVLPKELVDSEMEKLLKPLGTISEYEGFTPKWEAYLKHILK